MAKKGRAETQKSTPPEVVDPRWLLWAALVMVGVGLVCGYATFCVLFYQGQWQMMLHPVRTAERPATIDGGAYQVVRFGPDATGRPARIGWWIPARASAGRSAVTLLFLPSGTGSLAQDTKKLEALRATGVALFAIDYEGYGESLAVHPSEERMRQDAEAAWRYLVEERAVPGATVVPYGVGLGGVMAAALARAHPEIPGLVLDGPDFDVVGKVKRDPRVRLLPVMLLLKDRFSLEPELQQLKTPKLILSYTAADGQRALLLSDPKMTVTMSGGEDASAAQGVLDRFLDMYVGREQTTRPEGARHE